MTRPAVLVLLLALAGPAPAAPVDDSDLSVPGAGAKSRAAVAGDSRRDGNALVFPLLSSPLGRLVPGKVTGRVEMRGRDGSTRPTLYAKARVGSGPWTLLPSNGAFELDAPASGRFRVRVSLDNERWDFEAPGGESYEWESGDLSASASGVDAGVLSPVPGSEGAKLGLLHLTYLEAASFLAREAELAWWTRPYKVVWPGDADYYNSWSRSITLSDATAWDVVLHELGHAVMDGAFDASGGGGSHKIDQCYTPGLAWTEGWATYFAGAVALSPDDSDARFEFLVPRRAPIRLENVPADVCAGPANEWRVAAGLWDLSDRHIDGEGSPLSFRAVWDAARAGRTASVGDLWSLLSPRLDPGLRRLAQDALARNTLLSPAAPLTRAPRLPTTPPPNLFDGRKR